MRALSQHEFDHRYGYQQEEELNKKHLGWSRRMKQACTETLHHAHHKLPIYTWLKTYRVTKWLLSDVLAGVSVAMMQMPQDMGYALLASVPVRCGLYASLLPLVLFVMLSSSRHAAYGMAVFSAMIIRSIIEEETREFSIARRGYNDSIKENLIEAYSAEQQTLLEELQINIATSATLVSGIILLLMYVCRFGILASFIGEAFIGGFIVGGNCHVIINQFRLIFGIEVKGSPGWFSLFYLTVDILKALPELNVATLVLSTAVMILVVIVKFGINNRFKNKLPMPIPIELIVTIVAIVTSHFMSLDTKYDVKTVDNIPRGLPSFTLPTKISLMMNYMSQCVSIALSSYILLALTAKLLAQKHHYEIDGSQEMLASSICHVVASCMSGVGPGVSPARSFLMDACGGRSQITYLVSSMLTVCTLLLIAPALEPLPVCVLGVIITTACLPIFERFRLLAVYWHTNKYDFSVFLVTFIATVTISIQSGMFIGIAMSVLVVPLALYNTDGVLLGSTQLPEEEQKSNTDIEKYIELQSYKHAIKDDGIHVYRLQYPICFLTAENMINGVNKIIQANVQNKCKTAKEVTSVLSADTCVKMIDKESDIPTCIILDMSAVSYIDTVGIRALARLVTNVEQNNKVLYLAGCLSVVMQQIHRLTESSAILETRMYPTIQQAKLDYHQQWHDQSQSEA